MKKYLCAVLALLMLVSLVACGENTPPVADDTTDANASAEVIDIAEGYKVVYDITNSTAIGIMSEMVEKIGASTGSKPLTINSGNAEAELEVEFGLSSGRSASATALKEAKGYKNDERSAYIIRAVGKKIVVTASDNDALRVAANRFAGLAEGGKLVIPVDFDETVVYNTDTYQREGELKLYDAEKIGFEASLSSLKVNGDDVVCFAPDTLEYMVAVAKNADFKVEAVAAEGGASLSVSESANGATVHVISINGREERTYILNRVEMIESEVVNKNGADATVTFVLDDGDKSSATFVVEEMAPKYSSLTASFALITNKLATLDIVTNPDGTKEYDKDEDGFYTYKKNESEWAYWENIAANKRFELVSHSHTHKYWGEDDNGGVYTYYNTAGEEFKSESLPKGSVSKEFVASRQIIQDLDPSQLAAVFVRSGLTAGGKNVNYSSTFWNPILESGSYIGGRGTHTYPDKPKDMVNVFADFDQPATRAKLKSYMVQHYNTNPDVKTTQAGSGPAECLAAGIPYWTNYIDTAVEMKGWAAFCIHNIRPDTHDTRSGHYIYQSQAEALFAHADALAKENKVWVATLSEGMIYANEWSTASVQAYVQGDKVVVSLDHKEEGSVYNMPLTVKVALPAGKSVATLDGKGLVTFVENGKTYAYVDVAPMTSVQIEVK